MDDIEISFEQKDLEFTPQSPDEIKAWIVSAIHEEKKELGFLNFIFTSDKQLLSINQEYLNHDTYTDIITFDYCENNVISGDIFLSIDRIRENAETFQTPFLDELHRVIIHGVMHLCGYADKRDEDKALMSEKEDYYLTLRTF